MRQDRRAKSPEPGHSRDLQLHSWEESARTKSGLGPPHPRPLCPGMQSCPSHPTGPCCSALSHAGRGFGVEGGPTLALMRLPDASQMPGTWLPRVTAVTGLSSPWK